MKQLEKESKYLEYKEQLTKTYLKTVSAFANYHDGTIVFGVSDDLKVVGLDDPSKICLSIENQINDSISPCPDFELKINNDKTVSLFVKKGYLQPYTYNDKSYKRNDTSTVEVGKIEQKRLIPLGLNQNYEDLPSSLQKLNFNILKTKLSSIIKINNFNNDVLKSLNLFNDETGYNIAASLLSDKNNMPGLDIGVFGSSLSEIKNRKTLSNISIIDQFDQAMEMFKNYYVSEVIDNGYRKDKELVPFIAYREAVSNALIHRVWDVSANSKIEMYSDKIVISSPGGLPDGISEEQYINGSFSILRNPIISNVFYRLKIVEIFATGLRKINEAYRALPVKPTFDIKDDSITIVLPAIIKEKNSSKEKIVLDTMKSNQLYSARDLSKLTNIQKATLIRTLNKMIDKKVIIKSGNARATTYKLNNW